MRRLLALVLPTALGCLAQTTQGLIAGRIVASNTGRPVANAEISFFSAATHTTGTARSGRSGYYVLPLLPPGQYRIRVTADRYQAQELHELDLPVAARLDLNFRLRLLTDVWETGQYRSVFLPNSEAIVTFYGPDVDTTRSGSFEATRGARGALEATVSHVIDPAQVRELPLAGRDVYTMLVTQPGVAADTGTARGLGLSINGQRPPASNFLLDGVENNNYLLSGPLTAIAPEAVQEYRVSTSSFSAEYGRTAGFVANAVTRSGGSQWHGIGYLHLKNDALNANGFRENLAGLPRLPLKETQLGFHAGGPLRARSLFFSSAWERLRSRSRAETVNVLVPSTLFGEFTAPGSVARGLLERFPAPPVTDRNLPVVAAPLAPPVSVDRSLALKRADYISPGGGHRVMGRLAVARIERPDFIWTPYKDFVSGLRHNTYSLALSHVASLRPSLTNELRFGWSTETLGWDRAHPEIPTLASGDGTILPGSPAFYAFRNRSRSAELVDSLTWAQGRHMVKAGGGLLFRRLEGFLTAGRDGRYLFQDFVNFTIDRPDFFSVSVLRERLPGLELPRFDREYRSSQTSFFVQDTFKAAARLALNFGVRYENFSAPRNAGPVKDATVELGPGADFAARVASARVVFDSAPSQKLYRAGNGNWAARFGFSYDPLGSGKTLVRGAYGLFYDRPFDNLWQNLRNNNLVLPTFVQPGSDYLASIQSVLARYRGRAFATDFPRLTLFEPDLRNAYAQSYFLGVQQQVAEAWSLDVSALGSLGRRLLTTDQVNRRDGPHNAALPILAYRAAQGLSSYHALAAVARYRARQAQLQVAYTWSHAIDLQSDALAGDFFDLSFARVSGPQQYRGAAAFARQFDSRGDRGSSDFDQRHNLVWFSIWELPGSRWLFRHWRLSQLAAFRSGFPYTVYAPSSLAIFNNRADVLQPQSAYREAPVAGGKRLLNADAFREPPSGRLGNSGRNAFRGPGLFNLDVSLSRSFALRRLGEAGRITLRVDAFNVLNHANLNNPDSVLGSNTFGFSLYGRRGRETGFPALAPWQETARQIQAMLRVEF